MSVTDNGTEHSAPHLPQWLIAARERGRLAAIAEQERRFNRSIPVECPDCGKRHRRVWIPRQVGSDKKARCPECAYQRHLQRKQAKQAERHCDHCGERFMPKRRDARFCCAKCRVYANRSRRADQ